MNQLRLPLNMPFVSSGGTVGQPGTTYVSIPHGLTAQQLASIRMPMTASSATSAAGTHGGQSLLGTSIPSSTAGGGATSSMDSAVAAAAMLQQQQSNEQAALLDISRQLLAQQQQQQQQQHFRTHVMEESTRQQQQQAAIHHAFQQQHQNAAIANAQRLNQQQQQKRRSIDASASNSNTTAHQTAQVAAMNTLIQQQQQQQLKQMQALSGSRPLVAATVNNNSNNNNTTATQLAANALAQLGLTPNGMMPSVLQLTAATPSSALGNIPSTSNATTRLQFNPAVSQQQQQEVAGRQLRFSVPGSSGAPSSGGGPGSTASFSMASATGLPAANMSTTTNVALAAPATSASPSFFISANGMPFTNIQLNQFPATASQQGARPSVSVQQQFAAVRGGVPVQNSTSIRPPAASMTLPTSSAATTTLSYEQALLLAHATDSARRAGGVSAATSTGNHMQAPASSLQQQQTPQNHSSLPVNLLTLSNVAAAQPQVPIPSTTQQQQQQQQIFRAAGMPTNIAIQQASGAAPAGFSFAAAPNGSIPFGLLQAATNSTGVSRIPLLLPQQQQQQQQQQQTRALQIGGNAVNNNIMNNVYGGARYENISPSPNETPEAQPASTSAADTVTLNNIIAGNFLNTAGGQLHLLQQQQQQQINQQRQKAGQQQQFVLSNAGSGGGGSITKLQQQPQRGASVVNDFGGRPGSSLSKASPATSQPTLLMPTQQHHAAGLSRQQPLVVNGSAAQSRQQQVSQQFAAAAGIQQQQQQQLLQPKRQSLGHVSIPPNILQLQQQQQQQQQHLQQLQQQQQRHVQQLNVANFTGLQQQPSQHISTSPERRAAIEARYVYETELNKASARSETLRKRLDSIRQRQATSDTYAGQLFSKNTSGASMPSSSGSGNNNMLAISSSADPTAAKVEPVFVDDVVRNVMEGNRNVVRTTHAEKVLVNNNASQHQLNATQMASGMRRSPSAPAASSSSSSLFSLWPTLQKQSLTFIMKRHSAIKRQIVERISRARTDTDARLDRLAELHNRLEKAYIEKSRQAENDFDPKTVQLFENIFPEIRKDREDFRRDMRSLGLRTKGEFDDYEAAEYENLIAPTMPSFALLRNGPSSTLSALNNHASRASREEIMKLKKTKKLVVPVPLGGAFDYLPRGLRYTRTCGFIDDPIQEHKRTLEQLNNWTEYEKDVFKEKFMERPKDFRSISQALPRKSVSDCILYYYARKKQDNFNKPLRRYPTRGGRRGRYNNRTLAQRASAVDIAGAGGGLNGAAAGTGSASVGAAVLRKRGGAGILAANGMSGAAAGMLLLNSANNGGVNGGLLSGNNAGATGGAAGGVANGFFGLGTGINGAANGLTAAMLMNGTLGSLGPIGVSTLLLHQQHQQQQAQDASFLDDWSNKEKQAFRRALFQHGTEWTEVSRIVGTRNDYECKRYYELHSETWRPQIEQHMKRQREASSSAATMTMNTKPNTRLRTADGQTNAEPTTTALPGKKALVAAAVGGGGGLKRPITAVAADGEAAPGAKSPKSDAKDSNATLSADEEANNATNAAAENTTAKENKAPNQQETSKKRAIEADGANAMPSSSSPKRFALDASTNDAHFVANVMTQFASGAVISTSTNNNNNTSNNNNGVIDIDMDGNSAVNPKCVRDLIHSAIEKNLNGTDAKPTTSASSALFGAFNNYAQQMMVNSSQPTLVLQQQQNNTVASANPTTQDGLFARQTDYQRLLQQHGAGLLPSGLVTSAQQQQQVGNNTSAPLMMLHPFSTNTSNNSNVKPPSGSITLGTPNKAAGGVLNFSQQQTPGGQQQQQQFTGMQATTTAGARQPTLISLQQQQQQQQLRPQQQQFMPIMSLSNNAALSTQSTVNNNPTTFQQQNTTVVPSGQHAYMIPGTGQIIFVPSNIAAQLQQQPQQQFAIAVSNAGSFNAGGTNVVRLATGTTGATTLEQQQRALSDALAAAAAAQLQQRPVLASNHNNRPVQQQQQQLITIQPQNASSSSSNAVPVSAAVTSGGGITSDLSHASTSASMSTLSPAQQFMLFQQQQQQQQQHRPPQSTVTTSTATIVSSVAGGGIRPQFASSGAIPTNFVFPLQPQQQQQQHQFISAASQQQKQTNAGPQRQNLTAGNIIDAFITRQITKDHNPAAVVPSTTPSSAALKSATPISTTISSAASIPSLSTPSPIASTFVGQNNRLITVQQHNMSSQQQIAGYTTLPIVRSVNGTATMPSAVTSAGGNGHTAIQIIGGGLNTHSGANRTVATRGALAAALPGTTLGDHIEQLIANDITRSTPMSMPTMNPLTSVSAAITTSPLNAAAGAAPSMTPPSTAAMPSQLSWVRAATSSASSAATISTGPAASGVPASVSSILLPSPTSKPATLLVTTPLSAVPVSSGSAATTLPPGAVQVLPIAAQVAPSLMSAHAGFANTSIAASSTSPAVSSLRLPAVISSTPTSAATGTTPFDWRKSLGVLSMPPVLAVTSNPTVIPAGGAPSPKAAVVSASPFILSLAALAPPPPPPPLPGVSASSSNPATTPTPTLLSAAVPPVLSSSTAMSVAGTSSNSASSSSNANSAESSSAAATAALLNGPAIKSPVVVGANVVVPGVVVVAGNVANSPLPQPDYEPISPPEDTAAHTATSPRDAG